MNQEDRNHFGLDGNHCGLDGNHFGLDGNHFGLDGNHFGLDGNHFGYDDMYTKMLRDNQTGSLISSSPDNKKSFQIVVDLSPYVTSKEPNISWKEKNSLNDPLLRFKKNSLNDPPLRFENEINKQFTYQNRTNILPNTSLDDEKLDNEEDLFDKKYINNIMNIIDEDIDERHSIKVERTFEDSKEFRNNQNEIKKNFQDNRQKIQVDNEMDYIRDNILFHNRKILEVENRIRNNILGNRQLIKDEMCFDNISCIEAANQLKDNVLLGKKEVDDVKNVDRDSFDVIKQIDKKIKLKEKASFEKRQLYVKENTNKSSSDSTAENIAYYEYNNLLTKKNINKTKRPIKKKLSNDDNNKNLNKAQHLQKFDTENNCKPRIKTQYIDRDIYESNLYVDKQTIDRNTHIRMSSATEALNKMNLYEKHISNTQQLKNISLYSNCDSSPKGRYSDCSNQNNSTYLTNKLYYNSLKTSRTSLPVDSTTAMEPKLGQTLGMDDDDLSRTPSPKGYKIKKDVQEVQRIDVPWNNWHPTASPVRSVSPLPIVMTVTKPCGFCRTNGESAAVYGSHTLRDNTGVLCPILSSHICKMCGATGKSAHTLTYCPMMMENGVRPLSLTTLLKSTRKNSNGNRYKQERFC